MSRETNQNLKLGFFVTLGLIIFVAAIYFIGSRQNLFGSTVKVSTVYDNVSGLQVGNNVQFGGIKVGIVRDIEITAARTLLVHMRIEKSMQKFIRKDALAVIASEGLMGDKMVKIIPRNENADVVDDGDFLEGGPPEELIPSNLSDIPAAITDGKGVIGTLIKDTLVARDFRQIIYDLQQGTSELKQMLASINANMAQTSRNLAVFTGNLAELSTNLAEGKSTLGKLMSDTAMANNFKQSLDSALNNLNITSQRAAEITENFSVISQDIRDGKGAIGVLTRDSLFAANFQQTMVNVTHGTNRLNNLMEALQHNFLFRGYFKKQDRNSENNQQQN